MTEPAKNLDPQTDVAEREYEDSPNAPFNRKTERPLGPSADQHPDSLEDKIEKEKQYFHGGKKP